MKEGRKYLHNVCQCPHSTLAFANKHPTITITTIFPFNLWLKFLGTFLGARYYIFFQSHPQLICIHLSLARPCPAPTSFPAVSSPHWNQTDEGSQPELSPHPCSPGMLPNPLTYSSTLWFFFGKLASAVLYCYFCFYLSFLPESLGETGTISGGSNSR